MLALSRKYPKAIQGYKESQEVFEELDGSTDKVLREEWVRQEKKAQSCRHQDESAMDIYEVKLDKGEQLFLVQEVSHQINGS